MCRDIATYTSTSVVSHLNFACFFSLLTGMEAASLNFSSVSHRLGIRRSPQSLSPLSYHMDDGGRNRNQLFLGSESEVVLLFASYIGFDLFNEMIDSTRNISSNYPCRYQNIPIVWRGRRDLNPRAGCPTYTLSRGASSAT